jgi:signal transduction histidine kinase
VRIKDNGEGMPEEVLNRVHEPYFTTRKANNYSGLGMHLSEKIIKEQHKGEMKIESLKADGTDVYIKFFTA